MLRGIWEGVKKEFLLVASQRTAILLVLLFPLIIIGTFGGLFSTQLTQSVSLAVFVDQASIDAASPDANAVIYQRVDFLEELKKNPQIVLVPAESEQQVHDLVMANRADGGLIIHKESHDQPYEARIVVDTTDFVQSNIIWGTASNQISTLSNEFSVALLQKIWDKIVAQEGTTDLELKRIDDFLVKFQQTKQRTKQIEKDLEALDLNHPRAPFNPDNPANPTEYMDVGRLRDILRRQHDDLGRLSHDLQEFKAKDDSLLVQLRTVNQAVTQELVPTGLMIIDPETGAQSAVVPGVNTYVHELANMSSGYDDQLYRQQLVYSSVQYEITNLNKFADALDAEANAAGTQQAQLLTFVRDAVKLQDQIESDLLESRQLLFGLQQTIRGVKAYPPAFLAAPVRSRYVEAVHLPNLATALFPMILALVAAFTGMMLGAISVISEKKQNVIARLRTLPVHATQLVLEKVIGVSLLVLLELGIMVAVGTMLFGIAINGPLVPVVALLALITAGFVCLGVAIGDLTTNESSAIMAVLVICLPMVFLSGLLVPLEMLPPGFLVLKIANPLSAAATVLTNVMVKNLPLFDSMKELAALTVLALAGLFTGILKYF